MTTFIAQLSDSHITTGPLGAGPAAGLQLALARVMGLDPRPDCVVITGDLTDHGRPDEYAALVLHVVANRMLNGAVLRLDGALRMAAR